MFEFQHGILKYTKYICISGLSAAIFNFRLPVTSASVRSSSAEFLDPENGGLVVETALLSCLEAEIYLLPV